MRRTSRWVVRGGDSGYVVILAQTGRVHRQEPQLPPGIRLRTLELSSSHLSEPGPATVLTLPKVLWSAFPVSPSSGVVTEGQLLGLIPAEADEIYILQVIWHKLSQNHAPDRIKHPGCACVWRSATARGSRTRDDPGHLFNHVMFFLSNQTVVGPKARDHVHNLLQIYVL